MALRESDSGAERGWDPIVRVTHWGIATAVLMNGLVTTDGSQLHVWIGYAALALRLLWGLIGTSEARFSAFPPVLEPQRPEAGEGRRLSK